MRQLRAKCNANDNDAIEYGNQFCFTGNVEEFFEKYSFVSNRPNRCMQKVSICDGMVPVFKTV